ncbi:hypothetical protein J4E93_008886 [Alternaria ventricosa]|uniref:uncharacterized protein n=1 Tax=Alternaria ventricosa TaxID=1187951 RepID=UPI0020C20D7C|nr:uncharacterized protein J4E93_008886 [Alternaria ventricosa]KAI4640086.1 hypothetical protein J4E93_008886 [Alternaria ventricosa]
MAPRRSGGGGTYYSNASCPHAFHTPYAQAALAFVVLFLVLYTVILISTFFIRKKSGAGKKLIGVPFVVALSLQVISRILSLVSQVMSECDNINYIDYWNINVASAIMNSLANAALLFVFVYVLNSMLHKQFGNMSSGSKTVLLITIGVAFAVILADVVMYSYVALADNSLESNWDFAVLVSNGLDLAYDIVWMIVVIISAAMSLSNVSALRSRRLPGGDLFGWVTSLYVSLFVNASLGVVFSSSIYWPVTPSLGARLAWSYIIGLAKCLAFITLLGIAKHVSWNQTIEKTEQTYAPVTQQQVTYGYGNGQQDYYQQTPELVHVK